MPAAPEIIVLTKRSWPGTSTILTSLAGREFQPGKSQVDGHLPGFFFLAIGRVYPGQGADEGRFTVVNVSGCAEYIHEAPKLPYLAGGPAVNIPMMAAS